MRKITLMLTLLAFAFGSFSQDDCTPRKAGAPEAIKKEALTRATKAETIYWSENFDGARWSATVTTDDYNGYKHKEGSEAALGAKFTDGLGNKFYFHWSDKGPRGRYTGSPDSFDPNASVFGGIPGSSSNGVLQLEMDFYNTDLNGEMVADPLDMDAYAMFGPIDLSGADAVSIRYNQLFRYCCSATGTALSYSISSDYDPNNPQNAHWAEFDGRGGTVGNSYTNVDARTIERNISAYAANKPAVYIMFRMYGGSHYFWMIDDIEIFETPKSNVYFTDSWVDYWDLINLSPSWTTEQISRNFLGGYTNIPAEVNAPYVQTRAAVYNDGADAQTVKLNTKFYKGDTKVYDETSSELTLDPLGFDTLRVTVPYFAEEKGAYMVSSTLVGALEGNKGTNTGFGYSFNVTDNYFSRVYANNSDNWSTAGPSDWAIGGNDGDKIVNEFNLFTNNDINAVTIAGIRVFIPYYNPTSLSKEITDIKDGKFSMRAVAFASESMLSFAKSEFYHIAISDTGSWIYLPFIDEGNLTLMDPVAYQTIYVGIECYTGGDADANRRRFLVGAELDGPKQANAGGLFSIAVDEDWSITNDNYAIDLYLNEMPLPQVNVTFNVDMAAQITAGTFVPGTDKVYLTGSFADADDSGNGWDEPGTGESLILTDADNDKIYSGVIKVDQNVGELQYKYFRNAGWANGDLPGTLNHITSIANVDVNVNDVWGDDGTAIEDNQLSNARIYPNPVNATLTVEGLVNVNRIVVSNVLGQMVMTISQVGVKEEINTSNLDKGIYMITIIDNNNNTRTERIVKQ